MDERTILEKIAESAHDMKTPEALKPQPMEKKLKSIRQKKLRSYRAVAAAACLCLCFGAGSLAYSTTRLADSGKSASGLERGTAGQDGAAGTLADDAGNAKDAAVGNADDAGTEEARAKTEPPLKKIGRMFTLASDYGEVYDVVEKYSNEQALYNTADFVAKDMDMGDSAAPVTESTSMKRAESIKEKEEGLAAGEESSYSSTNLQVAGVDESDIVKTDGKYIYVVQDTCVRVLNAQDQVPKVAGRIEPDLNEDTDVIREMYVADQVLTLIVQSEKSSIQQEEQASADGSGGKSKAELVKVMDDKIFYFNTDPVTKVMAYDIADPEKPVLRDTTTQDGYYQSSRKIENRLYLFTNQSMYHPILDLARNTGLKDGAVMEQAEQSASMKDHAVPEQSEQTTSMKDDAVSEQTARSAALQDGAIKGWIPQVNGTPVSADCIYLPKAGNEGLVVSCIDLAEHNKVLDTKLLINDFAHLYVTGNSAYLYYTDYVNGIVKTRIARFILDTDGMIRAKAATTLRGTIQDTFAIHERDGYLQVLTSVTSSDPWENRVYVLDENMETIGKLIGLAQGEQIYSARFTGEIGYFVTYRNTDPLFTVDFKDPANPKVIGELKVTGFSDYLHFWSENKLLGIGQETDPQSGRIIGIKLSMFDISNPAKVTEEGKAVLQDADESEALYNYKTVLVDRKKNLIAFPTETWSEQGYQKAYRVFSYQDGKFTSRLERSLVSADATYDEIHWRGLYIGDILYLVCEKKALAFDMEDGFKEIGKVKYVK